MALMACEDGTCTHTGTVCAGPVPGTLTAGSNPLFRIEGVKVMVDDGTMDVPTHNNPPCVPPNLQSHSYEPDTLANSYFYIEGKLAVLLGDSFSGDATAVDDAGTNGFVTVS